MSLALLFLITNSWGAPSSTLNCSCVDNQAPKSCGTVPAFMNKSETDIAHELGFDVPGDNVKLAGTVKGLALYHAFASFLEKSDRSRLFYPEYYTRATKDAAILTLKSTFVPKNISEMDEYFRCTIPGDKYCLYQHSLKPYIGLAAKVSGIDFSFLACQAYVESRFVQNAKSNVGATGYSQIQPQNIKYLNEILKRSMRNLQDRKIASISGFREMRINKVHQDIAKAWQAFWMGTPRSPKNLCKNDLSCYRQVFLAQALSLKTDMLAFVTSANLNASFDEHGDFRVEGMDKGDSLLLLAGSYNIGVTKMMKLIANRCHGSTKLKDCIDKIEEGNSADAVSLVNYIMRIRDCSQQFSAEKIDFDNSVRWTAETRTENQNQQRETVAQCLLHPCPYSQKQKE